MTSLTFGLDKMLRQLLGVENRGVPQRVKTKVYKRARGRCEWPRCRKRLRRREFHHWRDPPTERTTALLCHKHHVEHGHVWKVETDIFGNKKPVLVRRKRIPIPKRTRPKTTKTRRHRKKN